MPPLTVRTSVQSPEKIAGRLSNSRGVWSEIGADPWVMRIVQWGYKIPFVTLPPLRLQGQETTYPKGSLKWSSLSQSVQELRNKGAIEPAPLSRAFTADHKICPPSMSSCIARASLWRHLGQFSGPLNRPVVNLPGPERRLLSYRVDPADRRCFCHNGTSWQFTVLSFGLSTSLRVFPKYSNLY